ncbi:MAG: phage integrase SAM-like domain-containing protein [Patescibacteria group bacterium]
MNETNDPIIILIPGFLAYCKKIGLSEKTQINYKIFLNRFIKWLEKENKNKLPPHEFSNNDIQSYKLYLSSFPGEKGQPLKKVTQNYYLIALRALLGYFTAKDIESLPADKIQLYRHIKSGKDTNLLDPSQICTLLSIPDTKNSIGLRNKAILVTLIFGGFKIGQIKNLDRNQIKKNIPIEALPFVREYLKTRDDDCESLFTNYRSRKNSSKRLTGRSIERIINDYGKKIKLPFIITPEILRWSKAIALLNDDVSIKNPHSHKNLTIKNYLPSENNPDLERLENDSPAWNSIENLIKKELFWLKNNVSVMPESYKENPSFIKCDDCILRRIAILIVSGRIKAVEFNNEINKDIWGGLTEKIDLRRINRHGQEWHKKIMDVIHEYFKLRNYKIILEPVLNYGRADLGIYSNLNNNPIYVEVDTVSLFKLWYNLSTMKDATFLIIPSENKIIEFNV